MAANATTAVVVNLLEALLRRLNIDFPLSQIYEIQANVRLLV
jgi:hypothetical protein